MILRAVGVATWWNIQNEYSRGRVKRAPLLVFLSWSLTQDKDVHRKNHQWEQVVKLQWIIPASIPQPLLCDSKEVQLQQQHGGLNTRSVQVHVCMSWLLLPTQNSITHSVVQVSEAHNSCTWMVEQYFTLWLWLTERSVIFTIKYNSHYTHTCNARTMPIHMCIILYTYL